MTVATIGVVVGGAIVADQGSRRAARASGRASDAQERSQQEALDYQREVERLPLAVRNQGLIGLAGQYGLTFDEDGNLTSSDGLTPLQRAQEGPLYGELVRTGEEAVGRSASATGRLRGGATPANLADVNSQSLLRAYQQELSGLSGLAGTPLNTNAIAGGISGIGSTRAQGLIAQGQIEQQNLQNIGGLIGTGAGLLGSGSGAGGGAGAGAGGTTTVGVPINQQRERFV